MTAEGAAVPLPDADRLLDEQLVRAVEILGQGGLVAFPTETVYGLGADAASASAVAAIYQAKGRPADHPLIVHLPDRAAADFWLSSHWSAANRQRFDRLTERFWPGPLTLIVRRRAAAPDWACAGQDTVGLRCPAHPIAQRLLRAFAELRGAAAAATVGRGIAAPSANRFGRISPTTAQHVRDELGERAPLIVDGGATEHGLESTILDLSRARPVLLRPGAISLAQLSQALGEPVAVSSNVIDPSQIDVDAPRVSGALASHYAPLTALRIIEPAALDSQLQVAAAAGQRVAVLACDRGAAEYGQRLYARLRELDAQGWSVILVVAPPREPAWQAVWDRLLRAQTRPRL